MRALILVCIIVFCGLGSAMAGAAQQPTVRAFLLIGEGEQGLQYHVQNWVFSNSAARIRDGLERGWKVTSCWTFFASEHTSNADCKAAIEYLAGQSGSNDILVFYYAGHAIRGIMNPRPDYHSWTLTYKTLNECLSKGNAMATIVILDACYAFSASSGLGDDKWLLASCRRDEEAGAGFLQTWSLSFTSPFAERLADAMLKGSRGVRETFNTAMKGWNLAWIPQLRAPRKYSDTDLYVR